MKKAKATRLILSFPGMDPEQNRFFISPDGNVGIGTSTPMSRVDIKTPKKKRKKSNGRKNRKSRKAP